MSAEAFVDRHVSVLRALVAHGLSAADARRLADEAKATGRTDIRITIAGCGLVIRRMRGNHADVYLVSQNATD